MSLWEIEECLSITWNSSGDVIGARVNIKNHKLELIDIAVVHPEDDNFASAISTVSEKLLLPTTHLIIAGGKFENSVCLDLAMPLMPESDIRQAIQYELPRYIPVDPTDLVFGYRKIKVIKDTGKSPKQLVRIFAVMKKEWNELITDFTSSGVKFDAIVNPLMLVDPILEEENELYLPAVEPDVKFSKDEIDSLRQMVQIDEDEQSELIGNIADLPEKMNYDRKSLSAKISDEDMVHYIPAMLQAAFGLAPELREQKNHLLPLPKELIPERFRRLKSMFIIMLFLTLALIFALIGRNWWDDWSRLAALKDENQKVQNKIKIVQGNNKKLARLEEKIIHELQDAELGINNITQCFQKLSIKLPKEAWLSHFSTRDNTIDLSIKYPAGIQSQILPAINSSGIFKTKSSYTRRNTDNTENIYIHMDLVDPSEESGDNDAGKI